MPDLTGKIQELKKQHEKSKPLAQAIKVPIEEAVKLKNKLQQGRDWTEIFWRVFLVIYSLVGALAIVTMIRLNLGL